MVVYRDYDPVRRRVICFYKEYDPSKLEEIGFVDQVVTKYASEGEKLFSLLVDQYGPEPGKHLDADKSSGASGSSDGTVSSKMRVPDGGASSVATEADVALEPMAAVALSEQQSLPAPPIRRMDSTCRCILPPFGLTSINSGSRGRNLWRCSFSSRGLCSRSRKCSP